MGGIFGQKANSPETLRPDVSWTMLHHVPSFENRKSFYGLINMCVLTMTLKQDVLIKLIINLIHFAVPTTNYKIHERCSIFLTCMNVGPLGWVSRALNGGSICMIEQYSNPVQLYNCCGMWILEISVYYVLDFLGRQSAIARKND